MKGESDDTTGLLSALLKAHKDIKAIFYLGAAALAVDMLLVLTGKGNFASLSLESAAAAIGIVILALILWALAQNLLVPIVSSLASITFGSIWMPITNYLFPGAGTGDENPDDRVYVSITHLRWEIAQRPDPDRIAKFERESELDAQALVAARHLSYASAGAGIALVVSWSVPGTVVSELSIWWRVALLVMALAPWMAWTFTDVMKRRWIVDPELARRLLEERKARKKREEG